MATLALINSFLGALAGIVIKTFILAVFAYSIGSAAKIIREERKNKLK